MMMVVMVVIAHDGGRMAIRCLVMVTMVMMVVMVVMVLVITCQWRQDNPLHRHYSAAQDKMLERRNDFASRARAL